MCNGNVDAQFSPLPHHETKSIIVARTSKHPEKPGFLAGEEKRRKKKKTKKQIPVWEAEFTPAAIHESRRRAFCSGNFRSTHYPDRRQVDGVAHMCRRWYDKEKKKAAC